MIISTSITKKHTEIRRRRSKTFFLCKSEIHKNIEKIGKTNNISFTTISLLPSTRLALLTSFTGYCGGEVVTGKISEFMLYFHIFS